MDSGTDIVLGSCDRRNSGKCSSDYDTDTVGGYRAFLSSLLIQTGVRECLICSRIAILHERIHFLCQLSRHIVGWLEAFYFCGDLYRQGGSVKMCDLADSLNAIDQSLPVFCDSDTNRGDSTHAGDYDV